MIHYTLNTGHSRHSPRSEVSDDVIARCQPLLGFGQHPIPGTDCTLMSIPGGRSLMALVSTTTQPVRCLLALVVCGVPDDQTVWDRLASQYLDETDSGMSATATWAAPVKPASVPWCAVMLMPGVAHEVEQMDWLGDFERCLAWAWLERHRNN